jgi:hypothetical protein
MYFHFRVHHWVLWWFYVGIACGVVALVNILFRELTRTQETVILAIGVFFGCWAVLCATPTKAFKLL